jgi:hypothetical protein
LAALSSRFATARSIVAGTPWTTDSWRSVARPVAARPLDGVRGDEVEPHLLGLRRLALAARELDQLGDEGRHLVQLLDDVAEQPLALAGRQRPLAREHLDVRPQARERRPQLV